MRLIGLFVYISFSMAASAQTEEDNNYEQLRFIRIGSQNDLYQLKNQSDKYFSVGSSFELRHPLFSNVVAQSLLFGLRNSSANEYGVMIEQQGFTPADITRPEIDLADRPYAGLLYANFYRISSDLRSGLRIRSSLKIGVMGPAAGMEKVQKLVHEAIGSKQPIGWETQISNSLLLDYTFKISQKLPISLSFLEVTVAGDGEIGSVFNLLAVSMEIKLGLINNLDLYSNPRAVQANYGKQGSRERKFQLFTFVEPRISYVIYDGTISGGLIPFQESVHTLPRSAAESSLFFMSYGLASRYNNFVFRYRRVLRSDRFIAGDGFFKGDQFSWGEIDLVFLF